MTSTYSYFDSSQAVDEWYKKRRSKFTASTNSKLLKGDKQRDDELWSVTAKTYIESKVIELTTSVYERPNIEEVESLRHGKANELPSFERYLRETKNYSMTYMGDENPIFMPCKLFVNECGGTPDAANIVSTEGGEIKVDYGCELKNPVNPAYHFRRLSWKNQWDLKEGHINYYTQIQDLLRITGAYGWDFVSHDERQLVKSKQIKIIEVKPDRNFINNLELRLRLAITEKYRILSNHFGEEIKDIYDFKRLIIT